MYPRRSDFTAFAPGSAWVTVDGVTANMLDGEASDAPLVVQTRGADILYRLQQRFFPRMPYFPDFAQFGERVLYMLENQARARHLDAEADAIAQDRIRHRVSASTVQMAVWIALQQGEDDRGAPVEVHIPDGSILPVYAQLVSISQPPIELRPTIMLASAPFRATWFRRASAEWLGSGDLFSPGGAFVAPRTYWPRMALIAAAAGYGTFRYLRRR